MCSLQRRFHPTVAKSALLLHRREKLGARSPTWAMPMTLRTLPWPACPAIGYGMKPSRCCGIEWTLQTVVTLSIQQARTAVIKPGWRHATTTGALAAVLFARLLTPQCSSATLRYAAGPRVVRTAFDRLVRLPQPPPLRPPQLVWDSEPRVGTHSLSDGTVIRVYPLGEW